MKKEMMMNTDMYNVFYIEPSIGSKVQLFVNGNFIEVEYIGNKTFKSNTGLEYEADFDLYCWYK